MFRLYFRTILYMIGSKDNEKDEKCIVIIRNADKLRMQNTKYKSHIIKYQSFDISKKYPKAQ